MSSPALCPAQFAFEGSDSGWQATLVLFSMPLIPRFNCIGQCTIDSFVSRSQSCGPGRAVFQRCFNSPPTCFAVSLLSSLSSPQVLAPRTPFAEPPLIEVSSAKVRPRDFVLQDEALSRRVCPFQPNVQRVVTAVWGLPFRVFDGRPIFPPPVFS